MCAAARGAVFAALIVRRRDRRQNGGGVDGNGNGGERPLAAASAAAAPLAAGDARRRAVTAMEAATREHVVCIDARATLGEVIYSCVTLSALKPVSLTVTCDTRRRPGPLGCR
jgi:hypothetical protein